MILKLDYNSLHLPLYASFPFYLITSGHLTGHWWLLLKASWNKSFSYSKTTTNPLVCKLEYSLSHIFTFFLTFFRTDQLEPTWPGFVIFGFISSCRQWLLQVHATFSQIAQFQRVCAINTRFRTEIPLEPIF